MSRPRHVIDAAARGREAKPLDAKRESTVPEGQASNPLPRQDEKAVAREIVKEIDRLSEIDHGAASAWVPEAAVGIIAEALRSTAFRARAEGAEAMRGAPASPSGSSQAEPSGLGPSDEHPSRTIRLTFLRRPDGGLRVRSDDLPGLILSGADQEEVALNVGPAIKALLEHKGEWPPACDEEGER